MPASVRISVIVATWRREEPLALVLSDLARQANASAEILIVDQNTPPLPARIFAEISASPLAFTHLPHAPGVVAARNDGAAASAGGILLFIDDDVRIDDPHYLEKVQRNFDSDPGLAGVCGQELSPPDFRPDAAPAGSFRDAFEEACFFPRASTQRREVFHLVTCNCAIRRTAWDQVGGLDPVFAGNSYGDDCDLALRMRARGLRIVFDPEVSVRHTRAPRGGLRLDDPCNPWSEADRYFSLWVFYYRHVPPRWRRWYLQDAILGKSLLLKKNAIRPWRWPAIAAGLWMSRKRAREIVRRSSVSAGEVTAGGE